MNETPPQRAPTRKGEEAMADEISALRQAVEDLTHAVLGKRLTRAEVLERIGKDTHTLTRWIRRGAFPAPRALPCANMSGCSAVPIRFP